LVYELAHDRIGPAEMVDGWGQVDRVSQLPRPTPTRLCEGQVTTYALAKDCFFVL
jgi:hypothetical protein